MKTFIGTGRGSVQAAIDQALKGLVNPSMLLYVAPFECAEAVAQIIEERFPGVPAIGTIGTKLVNGDVNDSDLVVLGLFRDVEVKCGIVKNIDRFPVASIREIEKNLNQIAPGREDTVCIEYCTGNEESVVTTFQACLSKKQVPMAGGSALGAPADKKLIVCYCGHVYEDACVYALIKNKTGKVRVYKENIYKNNGAHPHFATKVDVDQRALIELDDRKAADVYSDELNIPKNKIIENVFKNPMGRVVGDQVFISSMKEFGKNGELINYKRINKNDCIYFLELGDYKSIEQETRTQIKSEMKQISLVLSIDCIYRYLLYQQEGYFNTYAKDMSTLGNHIGVVGGGEQYNNQHVNQTMVCAVFE